MDKSMKKNIIIAMIGLGILLATILTSVFYTSKKENSIVETEESTSRNKNINQTYCLNGRGSG